MYDASIFRVTEFDQEGERLATWQLPSGEGAPFQVTCAPDGRIIFFPAGHFPSEPGIVRWHVPVLWVSSDTRSPQLIRDEVPGPERALEVGDGGYWEIPWSRQLVLGATNEGVWMGTGDDYTLEFVGWNRSVLDTLDWAGRDQAVTPADIDQLRAELTQGYDEQGMARFLRESWPDYERVLPATVPAYSDLLMLDDGTLWIAQWDGVWWLPRLPDHPDKRWDVFNPSGEHVRQVPIPTNMRLLDAGEDWVLVVVRDSLGVETLAVYEFR